MNVEAKPTPPGQPLQITLFQQNMALLPPQELPNGENLYRGHQRRKALSRLTAFLKEYRPDVVGLNEMWVPDERQAFHRELRADYPHALEGPGRAGVYSLDSGLMLLSRMPFVAHRETVYPDCLGEDCLTQKGVLHARIVADDGQQSSIDIFLTHLQNPSPLLASPDIGAGSTGLEKVQFQLDHLQAFIVSTRDGRGPALLMGDLNTDGGDRGRYEDMLDRLGRPDDLWSLAGDGGLQDGPNGLAAVVSAGGITRDAYGTFTLTDEALSRRRSIKSAGAVTGGGLVGETPARHRQGERLDYFLGYPGREWGLSYGRTRVVCLESSPGRDVSDHYGLWAEVTWGR